ncbi:hypothetical protein JHK85_006775 [Glycine max]|nr:hypothetical protein JHK85_006775 [Glycine max]
MKGGKSKIEYKRADPKLAVNKKGATTKARKPIGKGKAMKDSIQLLHSLVDDLLILTKMICAGCPYLMKHLVHSEDSFDSFLSLIIHLDKSKSGSGTNTKKEPPVPKDGPMAHIAAQTFTFRELVVAPKNFRLECLLGEGGFERVYKGRLESTGLLHHPNLMNLIGYCTDGDQQLLVYEFVPLGSLEDHLHS